MSMEALALRGRGNASLKEAHPGLEVRAEVAWGGSLALISPLTQLHRAGPGTAVLPLNVKAAKRVI